MTAACFVLLYATALGLSYVVWPTPPRDGRMDVWEAGDTLYVTSTKYAVLGRDVLDVPVPKVLITGASNAGVGFRPQLLQPLIPCARVSNLAVGSSNISELSEIIDLVHEVQSPTAQATDTWVIGIWFGMFIDTDQRWSDNDRHRGDTDIDTELYRYGLYRRADSGPVRVLPIRLLPLEVALIRPYLMLEKVARDLTDGIRHALFVRPPDLTDSERERIVLTAQQKQEALEYWRQSMGPPGVSVAQIRLLQQTISKLLAAHQRVILVDLPLPKWHRDASPYYQPYERAARTELFDYFANRPGFTALAMPDLDGNEDYSDEVHAKLHLARVWSARLAAVIEPHLCSAMVSQLSGPAQGMDAASANQTAAARSPAALSP